MLLQIFFALFNVTDHNGVSGTITGIHIENNYMYVQVVYDFDHQSWGVYGVDYKPDALQEVVSKGYLQTKKVARKAFRWSPIDRYIRKKDYFKAKPPD